MSYESNLLEYCRILQSFLGNQMTPSAFVSTFMRMWEQDRDEELLKKAIWSKPYDELLIAQRQKGEITHDEFVQSWEKLWMMGPQGKRLRDLLDQGFSACDVFNEDQDREEYELDENGLREELTQLACELRKLQS